MLMLFAQIADAARDKAAQAVFQLDIATAGVLGGALATALTIIAKLFCAYLAERDKSFNEQRKADSDAYTLRLQGTVTRMDELMRDALKRDESHDAEFRMMYESLLLLHGNTATVMGKLEGSILLLAERISGLEAKGLHVPHEQHKLAGPAGAPQHS